MLAKGPTLPADEVFLYRFSNVPELLDLEDSVAPLAKNEARGNVVEALRAGDWSGKTVVVRVNAASTRWCHRDVIAVVEGAGDVVDCVMLPKVERAGEVAFAHTLLYQLE